MIYIIQQCNIDDLHVNINVMDHPVGSLLRMQGFAYLRSACNHGENIIGNIVYNELIIYLQSVMNAEHQWKQVITTRGKIGWLVDSYTTLLEGGGQLSQI